MGSGDRNRAAEAERKSFVSAAVPDTVTHAEVVPPLQEEKSKLTIPASKYYHISYVSALLFLGAIGLLMFFVLILYARSRDILYLYYFLFLAASFTGAYLSTSMYDWYDWTYTRPGPEIRKWVEAITLIALSAYCLFTVTLLDLKKQAPKLHNWILLIGGINALYGIIYWFVFPLIPQYEDFLFIASRSIILPMSLVAIAWVGYRIHSPFKSYFIVGSAFYFTGALLAVLRQETSVIPFNFFYNISSTNYFHSGIFFEIVLFALALTHRISLINQAIHQEQEKMKHKAIFERDQAMAEALSSRMQSNPHLIFNSLSAINYLIQSNQNAKAIKSLNLYSRFVRKILDTGQRSLISLTEELDIIRLYIEQEFSRYDRSFTYSIHVDTGVDTEKILVPPMILMAFTEEVIWQKLSRTTSSDQVLAISVAGSQKKVQITIESSSEGVAEENGKPKLYSFARERLNDERIELYNKRSRSTIVSYAENRTNPQEQKIRKKYTVIIKDKT